MGLGASAAFAFTGKLSRSLGPYHDGAQIKHLRRALTLNTNDLLRHLAYVVFR